MKIAILGSVALPIPPPAQGGTEWISYYQAKGLAQKGHQVLLFAAQGTKKNFQESTIQVIEIGKGNVVAGSQQELVFNPSLMESSRKLRLETVYLAEVCQKLIAQKDSYDVILNNMRGEAVFVPIAQMLQKKFATVLHLNLFDDLADFFKTNTTHIISISNAQRKVYPDLRYIGTVYNGVDVRQYPYNPIPKDYMLMVGSIGKHKNQGAAIKVAKDTGMKLILVGKIRDKDYFEELKKDIDGVQIQYLGEISFSEKTKLYREAKVFLFPILWDEPFGLVMIEAMSCGTPVIAFNHGAVPEVVYNNHSGFIVQNEREMIEAVKKIDTIEREACRKHVEDNFTVEKMIEEYEKALLKL